MHLLIFNHIQNAVQSLRSNRLRSGLTMLGVTIGIASITTILALSAGANKAVSDQINALGGNIIVIRPGVTTPDSLSSLAQAQPNHEFAVSTLTETDLALINSIDHVATAAPIMSLGGTIKGDSVAPSNSPIVATTPGLSLVSNLQVQNGQFIDNSTGPNAAVIGAQLSINMFGTEQSIGQLITIRGTQFRIIGVLKRLNDPVNYNAVDFDNATIVGLAGGKQLNQGILQIQQINVRGDSIANLKQIIVKLNKTLLADHKGEHDFTILTGNQIAQPTSQLFYVITGMTTAIAAISLLVGGIGIMNIMLVSVNERTREIGIRKALGASNSDITMQFLIESLAISLGGGLAGYIIGYLLAFIISTFLTFDPIMNWQIITIALSISVLMGTVFGFYPALRAARKDPIESLRQYH